MTNFQKQALAVFELLFAGTLWGFGFIAAIWALESLSPLGITTSRFAVAGAVGLLLLAIPKVREGVQRKDFLLALIPGLLINGTLILQTWGLKYTTATKSGFITTLYVMIVPILEMVLKKKKLHFMHWPLVFVAMIGTALIVDLKWDGFNFGDFLTLLCAFMASAHIFYVGIVSPNVQNSFAFNTFQSFWAAMLALVMIPFIDGPHFKEMTSHAWMGMASLAFGSTLIAFYLQIKAQRVLSASLSSILFLMESPFAMIFAIFILGEVLMGLQFFGAALIFVSAACATLLETKRTSGSP